MFARAGLLDLGPRMPHQLALQLGAAVIALGQQGQPSPLQGQTPAAGDHDCAPGALASIGSGRLFLGGARLGRLGLSGIADRQQADAHRFADLVFDLDRQRRVLAQELA